MAKAVQKTPKVGETEPKVSFWKRNGALVAVAVVAVVVGFGGMFAVARSGQSEPFVCKVDTCIALDAEGKYPQTVAIKAGSTVQFYSADGNAHSLALAEGAHGGGDAAHNNNSGHSSGAYESGRIGADEAWQVAFKKDGAFSFRDSEYENIEVNVVVYTPGKDYKIQ